MRRTAASGVLLMCLSLTLVVGQAVVNYGTADALYHEGIALRTRERNDSALRSWDEGLANYSDHFDTLRDRASLLDRIPERRHEAADSALRALALRPDDPSALNSAGWHLVRAGRYEDGLPYLNRSLALRANHSDTLNSLAYALVGLGLFQEALAIVDLPTQRSPWDDFVRAAAHAGLGQNEASIAALDAAIAVDGELRDELARTSWFERLELDPKVGLRYTKLARG